MRGWKSPVCPVCGSEYVKCPECGATWSHGTISQCQCDDCRKVNAPMDCVGCGLVVASDSTGVISLDGTYKPYSSYVTHGI